MTDAVRPARIPSVVLLVVTVLIALTLAQSSARADAGGSMSPGQLALQQTIATGYGSTCVILDTDQVRCWGANDSGQLGIGSTANLGDNEPVASVPAVNLGPGRSARAIATGRATTCAILDNGAVLCWGSAAGGALGTSQGTTIGDNESPASGWTAAIPEAATQIAIADHSGFTAAAHLGQTCALGASGKVYCWGDNSLPRQIAMPGDLPAFRITARANEICALLDNRSATCWGPENLGNFGNASTAPSMTPVLVPLGASALGISSGWLFTCAVQENGQARCFGKNDHGQLGIGATTTYGDDEPAAAVPPVPLDANRSIAYLGAGGYFACALFTDHNARCWGQGSYGQLGNGSLSNIGDDEPIGFGGLVQADGEIMAISPGVFHTCAVLASGEVRCWGLNTSGELGAGTSASQGALPPSALAPVKLDRPAKAGRDSDGDGLVDGIDKCPAAAGPRSNEGCPLPPGQGSTDSGPPPPHTCTQYLLTEADRNNDGCPDRMRAVPRFKVAFTVRRNRILNALVFGVPKGAKITILCKTRSRKKCRAKRRSKPVIARGVGHNPQRARTLSLRHARLRPGAVIEVRVSAGKRLRPRYARFRITRRLPYAQRTAGGCMVPTTMKVLSCTR